MYHSSEEYIGQKRRQHTSLPQPLSDVKPFRVLPVIRTHASSHAFVELADNDYNSIVSGTQKRASATYKSSWSTESYALSMKHMYRGGGSSSLSEVLPSKHLEQQCRLLIVLGEPTLFLGSISSASQQLLGRDATIFSNTVSEWDTSEIPP